MSRGVEVLGRIAIRGGTTGGGSLPGRRAELVFAYLAAEHHRVVTQDELADALWPGTLPQSWASALRGVITEVRRYVEGAGMAGAEVLTTRRGYRLQLPAGAVVDLDEVREELARARASLDAGHGAAAATHSARSASMARLPFLPDHDGDWVDGIRRELGSIHTRALDIQVRGHRAAGDLAAAGAAAEELVRADPFNESGHQLRIRVLSEAGDRAGALKAYEHCRALLEEELGVEPSAETAAALGEAMRPADRPSTTRSSPARQSSGPARLADLSVLVVEDHDFQRRITVRLLHGQGVGTVADAPDGASALAFLAGSQQPDIIVCDIDMPGMDGVEFIRHVSERGLACAVVIVSGLDSKVLDAVKTIAQAKGMQVLGALEKPLTPRRLGELLANYRRGPRPPSSDATLRVSDDQVVAAVAGRQITAAFEPAVDVGALCVTRAEARGRWLDPALGEVPPAAFTPVLEAKGLGLRYVEALLEDACAALARCRVAGLAMGIGVDLGAGALADIGLADRLHEAVRDGGAEPSDITFEVNEHVLATAPPVALDVVTRIRVKGFGLALDHFGTRQASLDRWAHIPFTEVKLDGSLLSGPSGHERQRRLEEACEAAESLHVPLVATGCGSENAFDLVVDMGIRYVQGSFVGAAMNGVDLVRAGTWRPPDPG